jgi:signal transduction histidine kinase
LDSSRYYANRSITEQSNDKFRAAFSQRLLGEILFIEGRNAESIRYYEIAMKAAIESNNNFLKASVLYRMGETYLKMGNFEKALPLLLEDQQLASRYGYNGELESTYKILIKAYAMRKDFQQAYAYQQKYTHFHDSLATFRNDDQLAILEQEHETKLKNAQIELLTKDSRLKESEIESQQILIYGVCAALFILLALVVMLVRVNQHSKKLNRILANQNHVILDQKEQLSALNKTKDKLFSIIGHDLRSPINSLRGLMDLMDNASLSQDEFIHYSKNLKNNVNAVSADLTNLLSWAQSQQKGLSATFEDLHLHKEVVEKIELYREALKVKSLQLVNKIDFTIVISADKNHLGIIIRNLIGNAIKFSVNGGTINLSSNVLKDLVEVTVSDAGIGMSPEELGKLFNPTKHFSKTGTNQEKGLGLGLLLVKEFVELNNGTIRVESAPGKGSSFTFSLQLKSVKGLIAPL